MERPPTLKDWQKIKTPISLFTVSQVEIKIKDQALKLESLQVVIPGNGVS